MRSVLLFSLLGLAACGSRAAGAGRAAEGSVSVRWTGKSNGTFTGPAIARWCPADTLLEITSFRNDTAVGLVLFARDSLGTTTYPVGAAKVYTAARPQSNVALRWLAEFEVKGYDAWSGQVVVSSGGARSVSGTFDVKLRPLIATDSLRMTGTFDHLAIVPAAAQCGRADRPATG